MNFRLTSARVLWLMISLLVVTSETKTQQQPARQPEDRRNQEKLRQQEMSRREWQLRNFGIEPKGTPDNKRTEALGEQIEQDFNRILVLHNQFVRIITSEQKLDYGFISAAAEEIKKRASRLQKILALETEGEQLEGKNESSDPFSPDQLKPALITLCKQIRSFVTNPVIEVPGTVNAEQLERARSDLDRILKGSQLIHKSAVFLNKSGH